MRITTNTINTLVAACSAANPWTRRAPHGRKPRDEIPECGDEVEVLSGDPCGPCVVLARRENHLWLESTDPFRRFSVRASKVRVTRKAELREGDFVEDRKTAWTGIAREDRSSNKLTDAWSVHVKPFGTNQWLRRSRKDLILLHRAHSAE